MYFYYNLSQTAVKYNSKLPRRTSMFTSTSHAGLMYNLTQRLRPTQPSILSGMENEYQPMGGDAAQLGSKGRYGSCSVAGKIV